MKLLGKNMLAWGAALLVLLVAAAPAVAEIKPVIVVSVASVEKVLSNVSYLSKVSGFEDAGKTGILLGNAYTNGIDKKRPAGVLLAPKPDGGDFIAISFVPVSDLKTLLAIFKEQTGEAKDVGDGVLELNAGLQPVYIKEANGWAFVSQHKEHLSEAPADPSKLLGDLPQEYTLAARVLVQNLPAELKKMATDQIRIGFEESIRRGAQNDKIDPELLKKLQRDSMEQIIQLFDELDQITLGFAVDPAGQRTYLDTTITAVPGSSLAKQAEREADVKSSFTGFLMPDAAFTFNFAAPVSKEEFDQSRGMLDDLKGKLIKQIDDDPNLDSAHRTAAKELIGGALDVLIKTAEEGKLDGGAVLMLEPKSLNFAAGGLVADGSAVEAMLKKVADLAKEKPDAPAIKLRSGQHGGVNLHTVTAPIPDGEAEAREILGDRINVVIGTGPKSIYVSFGKDAEGLLKKVIDKNSGEAKAVPPAQFNVSVLPILKFAASVDDNPIVPELVKILEKSGKDKINLLVEPRPRGSNVRFQVEEGVLQAIGEAAKKAGVSPPGAQF